MKAKLIKTGNDFLLKDMDSETLVITSGTIQGRMLSLKNCQTIERGYDLDALAELKFTDTDGDVSYDKGLIIGFKDGFQKALELMGDKKFSREFLLHLIPIVLKKQRELTYTEFNDWYNSEFLKMILDKKEWDVEIEMICPHPEATYVCGIQYGCDEDGCNHPNKIPLLDTGGCLILKKI